MPIKYIRHVEETGEVSSIMEVRRFREFEIEGRRVGFPLEVHFEETGADEVSLAQSVVFTVKEDSIRINHDMDDELFTLSRDKAQRVRDIDEQRRAVAAAHAEWESQEATPESDGILRRWLLRAAFLVILFVGVILAFKFIPRSS